jgi:uncharacterized protein
MNQLELNLEKISQLAIRKEDQNYRFRSFLKMQDPEKIDRIVHRLDREIREQINCTLCGNCCNELSPRLSDGEIDRLAQIDSISKEEFIQKFVESDPVEGYNFLKGNPCKYLCEKKCSVYSDRPEDCRSYPHTHKKDFNTRTMGINENYGICPIVFNVFERLKMEMRFR